MDFFEQLQQFSNRILNLKDNLKTEEATKTSLILPFFNMLGYDIFNPLEFVPEFNADVGTKKGEKVDYAILKDNDPIILIEVKSCDTTLNNKHLNQLYRYFSVTNAKFAILTNGIIYKFYSDLEEPNKMDDSPFLELDLLNLKDNSISELKRFRKDTFDMQGILDNASELKYTALVKSVLKEQIENPSDQFIRAILSKSIYNGVKTQAVLDKFRNITRIAFNQYINELMNEKFKNALNSNNNTEVKDEDIPKENFKNLKIEFTDEELYILDYLKSLINIDEIIYKKTDRYCSMQIGDNVRKWICRIYLKQNEKLFVLHQHPDEDYECEYIFSDATQLKQIKDLILKVANLYQK